MNIDELFLIVSEIKTEQARIAEQLSNYQKLIDSVQNIALAVRDLANAQNNTSEEVKRLRCDVDDIKGKPAKRMDSLTNTILAVIATGIVTFALTKIFS